VCRSVNYNYNTYFCEMSTEDRRTKPNYMRVNYDQPVDYFDNNCLTRKFSSQSPPSYCWTGQNRCGAIGGNLVFVKTADFEIHYYDHTSSLEAHESYCLQKCLDSLNTFCRSVEYSPGDQKCIISDEDTFTRADQQVCNCARMEGKRVVCRANRSGSSRVGMAMWPRPRTITNRCALQASVNYSTVLTGGRLQLTSHRRRVDSRRRLNGKLVRPYKANQ
jgi:hypothetical protein